MKILCVSDQLDPLIYSNSIKERFSDVDLVLCAGDLPMEYVDFIVSSLNVPTLFVFGNHNLEDFYIYHPEERPLSASASSVNKYELNQGHGALYAGFKLLRLKFRSRKTPLLIAGASGSIKYNDGLCQYTDRAMKFKLIKLIPKLLYNKIRYGRFLDIFLAHSPPRHIQDREDPCHKGFRCYRWFLEKFKPTYMIHGHIHLYDLQTPRVAEYCDTTIINVFSYYLINFTKEEK